MMMSLCEGCKKIDGAPKVKLSCGHEVHTGIGERVHELDSGFPFFQIGKDFSCVRIKNSVSPHLVQFEEDPKGSLCCPHCTANLTEQDCCHVLNRTDNLEYGLSRLPSYEVREVVYHLIHAWSPSHADRFAVKTSGNSETQKDESKAKPDMRMKGFDRIKSLIEFYRQNPNKNMGTILTEAVFEANLRDAEQEHAFDMINKLVEGVDESKEKKVKVGVNSGVGYGGSEAIVLDMKSSEKEKLQKAQLEIDGKVEQAVKNLIEVLRKSRNKFGVTTEAYFRREWGVLSLLSEHLRNGSLTDIVLRSSLYLALCDLCQELAMEPMLVPLLLTSRPLRDHVIKWSAEAALALAKTKASSSSSANQTNPKEKPLVEGPPLKECLLTLRSIFEESSEPIEKKMCEKIDSCLSRIEISQKLHPHFASGQNELELFKNSLKVCNLSTSTIPELSSRYRAVMGKYAFRVLPFKSLEIKHHVPGTGEGSSSSSSSKNRQLAIKNTLANLKSSSPVEWYTSIFCAVDESRYDLLTFLIIGPDGTPYQNGCFHFDMYLPPDFPAEPPKAIFLTTGGGQVRFNPNLYADGKICLSLLGTWSGPKWNPKESTVLQVLLSIQSLILCSDPYYNEPGHESQMGSPAGIERSTSYNLNIKFQTLRLGILGMLKTPPKGFEDVVKDHFKLKAVSILKQCQTWREEMRKDSLESFDSLVNQFKQTILEIEPDLHVYMDSLDGNKVETEE